MTNQKVYEDNMNKRLIEVLTNQELYGYCLNAYTESNKRTGFQKPKEAAEFVLKILASGSTLIDKENLIWETLGKHIVKGVTLADYAKTIIEKRVQTMYSQIGDYILDYGKAADFGAGLGDFLRLVRREKPSLLIEGWDINDDDKNNDVNTYDGNHIPREDGYYDQVWQTTVLHHFDDPVKGIKEMSRIAKTRITILETLPFGLLEDKHKDLDITFVADYYYRLLLKSAEPVPGSYKTEEEWINLFGNEGWKRINSEVFKKDVDFAEFSHVRIVFEKK